MLDILVDVPPEEHDLPLLLLLHFVLEERRLEVETLRAGPPLRWLVLWVELPPGVLVEIVAEEIVVAVSFDIDSPEDVDAVLSAHRCVPRPRSI